MSFVSEIAIKAVPDITAQVDFQRQVQTRLSADDLASVFDFIITNPPFLARDGFERSEAGADNVRLFTTGAGKTHSLLMLRELALRGELLRHEAEGWNQTHWVFHSIPPAIDPAVARKFRRFCERNVANLLSGWRLDVWATFDEDGTIVEMTYALVGGSLALALALMMRLAMLAGLCRFRQLMNLFQTRRKPPPWREAEATFRTIRRSDIGDLPTIASWFGWFLSPFHGAPSWLASPKTASPLPC